MTQLSDPLAEIAAFFIALAGLAFVLRKRAVGLRLLISGGAAGVLSGVVSAVRGPSWLEFLGLLAAGAAAGGVVHLLILRDRNRGLALLAFGLLALTCLPLILAARDLVVQNLRAYHEIVGVAVVVILALFIAFLVFVKERFAAAGQPRIRGRSWPQRHRSQAGAGDRHIPRSARRRAFETLRQTWRTRNGDFDWKGSDGDAADP